MEETGTANDENVNHQKTNNLDNQRHKTFTSAAGNSPLGGLDDENVCDVLQSPKRHVRTVGRNTSLEWGFGGFVEPSAPQ